MFGLVAQEQVVLGMLGGQLLAAVVMATRLGIRAKDTRDRRETDH